NRSKAKPGSETETGASARSCEMIASARPICPCHCSRAIRAIRRAESCATRLGRSDASAADRMVAEPELGHCVGIEQISAVENNRRSHFFLNDSQVDIRELFPFGCNHQRLGIFNCFQRGVHKG